MRCALHVDVTGVSIRRHAGYNVAGQLIPVVLSLITIPIYLRLIGEARYGVLALAWVLLGYFGLLDLGLGRATAQRIAVLRSENGTKQANVFWTALLLNFGFGLLGGMLIWPVAAFFFQSVFQIEPSLQGEVSAVAAWLALIVPVAMLSGVFYGTLQGRERFLELNLITVLGAFLFQAMPLLAAVVWGPDLRVLLPAVLASRFLTLIALFARCLYEFRGAHASAPSKTEIRNLLRFGSWVAVTSVVMPIMTIFDRFFIGALIGANAVTYYTVPFQLAQRSTFVSRSLASSLFPRFASASPGEQHRLAIIGLQVATVIMTLPVCVGILLVKPFLSWWITPEFAHNGGFVGQVLLFGFWVNGLATIPFAQLQAKGRADLVAKCHLAELLPYVAALYIGLEMAGLAGAAIAFSARALADYFLLVGCAGLAGDAARRMTTPAILVLAAVLIAEALPFSTTGWLLAAGLLIGVAAGWVVHCAAGPLHDVFGTFIRRGGMISIQFSRLWKR